MGCPAGPSYSSITAYNSDVIHNIRSNLHVLPSPLADQKQFIPSFGIHDIFVSVSMHNVCVCVWWGASLCI